MIDTPQVVQTTTQLIAYIPLLVPAKEIQQVMGPAIQELTAAVAAQGIAIAGPWFTHHKRPPSATFDFEVCVPVAAQVTPAGRMKAGELEARKVARTVYHGPYEGLGGAWGELGAWIAANGHKPDVDLWECYLAGPEAKSDSAHWQTELTRPLTVSASS